MQELHLVGFTTDRQHLIFSARKGAKSGSFLVPVDAEVLAAIEQLTTATIDEPADGGEPAVDASPAPPVNRPMENRTESKLSVREVQARLRAGTAVAKVAKQAGVSEDWVERFTAPVRAEQRRIVDQALAAHLVRPRVGESVVALRRAVAVAMAERDVTFTAEAFDAAWSSRLVGQGHWVVEFAYTQRGKARTASWQFDPSTRALTSSDRTASQLGFVSPDRDVPSATTVVGAEPAPRSTTRVSASSRSGGSAKPGSSTSTTRRSSTNRSATASPQSAAAEAPSGADRTAAPAKKAPAKKAVSKKAPAKKAVSKKASATKAAPKKAASKKAPAKKAVSKKAPAKKAVSKKAPAKKAVSKKAPAKKAVSKKAPAKKATAKKAPAKKAVAGTLVTETSAAAPPTVEKSSSRTQNTAKAGPERPAADAPDALARSASPARSAVAAADGSEVTSGQRQMPDVAATVRAASGDGGPRPARVDESVHEPTSEATGPEENTPTPSPSSDATAVPDATSVGQRQPVPIVRDRVAIDGGEPPRRNQSGAGRRTADVSPPSAPVEEPLVRLRPGSTRTPASAPRASAPPQTPQPQARPAQTPQPQARPAQVDQPRTEQAERPALRPKPVSSAPSSKAERPTPTAKFRSGSATQAGADGVAGAPATSTAANGAAVPDRAQRRSQDTAGAAPSASPARPDAPRPAGEATDATSAPAQKPSADGQPPRRRARQLRAR